MKRPMILCPKCTGHGQIPLSDELIDVLEILNKHPEITAMDVHKLAKDGKWIIPSAINNRLVDLEKLQLVTREKRGKSFFWKAKRWPKKEGV